MIMQIRHLPPSTCPVRLVWNVQVGSLQLLAMRHDLLPAPYAQDSKQFRRRKVTTSRARSLCYSSDNLNLSNPSLSAKTANAPPGHYLFPVVDQGDLRSNDCHEHPLFSTSSLILLLGRHGHYDRSGTLVPWQTRARILAVCCA